MKEVTIFTENRGAFAPVRKYTATNSSDKYEIILEQDMSTKSKENSWTKCRIALRQVFLPYGYPNSVSKDYVTYQMWDTVQAFASSITGALATEAVMKGVGVGNDAATPLAAALTWLLKSGSGHIGQIVFAWAKGTSLDYDFKKWRLFADGLNDIATFIDLIAPLFPSNFVVVVLCSASVARALVGVAGSATRAAVTQHQARQNNMADVSAKDGSQETLVNLLALITSLILLPIVSGNMLCVWILYVIFTLIHLLGNYKAVTALEIESLNRPRLILCLQDYLNSSSVSSIRKVNSRESVVLGNGINDKDLCGFTIKLGESMDTGLGNRSKSAIELKIEESASKPFIIIPNVGERVINVVLHENISPQDVLEAYIRAVFLGVVLNQQFGKHGEKQSLSSVQLSLASILQPNSNQRNINPMDKTVTKEWENFKRLAVAQGFSFTQAPLETGEWRAKWMHH